MRAFVTVPVSQYESVLVVMLVLGSASTAPCALPVSVGFGVFSSVSVYCCCGAREKTTFPTPQRTRGGEREREREERDLETIKSAR